MSGIASLIALILVIFGLNMRSCLVRHMVPCVPFVFPMWHKNQKSVCAMILAIVNEVNEA